VKPSAVVVNDGDLTIGDVARRTGLRTSALRYYEAAGLLQPVRRAHGRRAYDASVFESLALIRLAQEAGFTVSEVRRLLSGFDRATPASTRWRSLAQRKLEEINARIERAERMRELLERLLKCRCDTLGQCVRGRVAALDESAD
jgi:MerR family transcriptional regulator, redox-sensitive transcriptional activator SoxR